MEATDGATLADFEQVLIHGYPMPELQPARAGSFYDARVLGGALRLWVGYVGDRPVSVAESLADEAVNGIYAVATLPEARGRGYGAATTAQAVAAYPKLPAVLESSEAGYRVYQRLGFMEVAHFELWLKPR